MLKAIQNFSCYPDVHINADLGHMSGPRRDYVVGQTIRDVSAEFAALLISKGHAIETTDPKVATITAYPDKHFNT